MARPMTGNKMFTRRRTSFCVCSHPFDVYAPPMNHRISLLIVALSTVSSAWSAPSQTSAPLVVLISVDGLKPEAMLEASAHGLKVPHLRAFMTDGVYANGVRGVLPTVTYPSHTTLITGASPARHG